MLNDLPQELLLAIISDLRIPEIANLSYLSRAWNDFIAQNESVIFHAAAILNHDVPRLANTPLDLLDLYSHRALSGVSTWKDLCVRLTQIKKSWAGIMPSTITLHQYTGDSKVHRFKVDEKAELIIATTTHGGITVTDLAASKWYDAGTHNPDAGPVAIEEYSMLWALPRNHVRPYAHCEYDHGYLIFDRFGASKEVWRLAEYDRYYPQCPSSDETPSPSPTVIPRARPDARQKDASSLASERWLYTGESSESEDDDGEQGVLLLTHRKKGHFVPWALLRPPTSTRAFRFVYPILLVASFVSVYLYDVRTGVLVQEIRDIQHTEGVTPPPPPPPPILGELFYVEHSPHHIFVCGDNCLRIFSRQTGQRVYDISAIFGNYGPSRWTISTQREFRGRALTGGYVVNDPMDGWIKAGSALYRHELIREEDRRERFVDRLMAAHVSLCGNYLTVMLETSRVLIIRDLKRIIKGEVSLLDSTVEVQLGRPAKFSKYLAFENGRVGLATRNGIFIIIPHPSFFTSAPLTTAPPPTVLRVHALNDPFILESITCLQMTQTGLFVNWSPTCPLARHTARDAESNGIHMAHEDVFWNGPGHPFVVDHQITGNAFIVEDEMLSTDPIDSVVLSVDLVPT